MATTLSKAKIVARLNALGETHPSIRSLLDMQLLDIREAPNGTGFILLPPFRLNDAACRAIEELGFVRDAPGVYSIAFVADGTIELAPNNTNWRLVSSSGVRWMIQYWVGGGEVWTYLADPRTADGLVWADKARAAAALATLASYRGVSALGESHETLDLRYDDGSLIGATVLSVDEFNDAL